MFNRSRRNLARWFTLSMGSILVTFASLLYVREVHDRLHTFDDSLYSTSQIMVGGIEVIEYQGIQQIDLEDVPLLGSDSRLLEVRLVFARWYRDDRRIMQFFGPIPPDQLPTEVGFITLPNKNEGYRVRQLTLPVYQGDRLLGYLQVAASLEDVEEPLQQLRLFLAIGVPVTLGAIALTGWVLGGAAMQPIRLSYQQLQRFTADASHELRAPLAGIISNAQVGLMEPIDPQEQTTRLANVSAVAESMSGLVNQLLFLARHDGSLATDALQAVDGVTLLQEVIDTITTQATTKHLTIIPPQPETTLRLWVEPDLMRQAIANLLSNACRYTPDGGTITVTLAAQTRWAVIRVADTGIGIAADALPHIFERFYRVDEVRSRQTGGVGLGLAIARQIVEAHNGHITATSEPGQGSRFEIRIPLKF